MCKSMVQHCLAHSHNVLQHVWDSRRRIHSADGYERVMKEFWDARAREHALFYVATWRGYERRDTSDFFIDEQEAGQFCRRRAMCRPDKSACWRLGVVWGG